MKYTKEQLDNMTDAEINAKVSQSWLPCDYYISEDGVIYLTNVNTYLGAHGEPEERTEVYGRFSPCSSWNDVMPILTAYKLIMDWVGDECFISSCVMPPHPVCSYNENPRRAICEVFLMMNV